MLRHRRALRKWLAAATLEPSHFWIMEELRLSSWSLPGVIQRAVDGSRAWGLGWEIDEKDAADSINELIARHLVEEVTSEFRERIEELLRSPQNVRSSSLLLPEEGDVSLSLKGSRLVVGIYEEIFRAYPSSPYAIDWNAGTIRCMYGMSEESLAKALWDHRQDIVTLASVGPVYSIGPWRSDWWYLHQSGVAVDVNLFEERGEATRGGSRDWSGETVSCENRVVTKDGTSDESAQGEDGAGVQGSEGNRDRSGDSLLSTGKVTASESGSELSPR